MFVFWLNVAQRLGYGLLRGLATNLANKSQVENHAVIFVNRQ